MDNEQVISEPLIDTDQPPAPGADDQKPKAAEDTPASAADDKKAESETPEQQAARRESRRARARARDAARVAAAETEARMLREQLAQARQQPRSPESSEPRRDEIDPRTGGPKYPDYESYLEARAEWRADQRVQAGLKSVREERAGREAVAGQEALAKAWNTREEAFRSTVKDYDEIVTPYASTELGKLSDAARQYIVESEAGPALLHHLADSDDHERIAGLSPGRQIAELARLEDSLSKKPAKASDAPPPIKPVPQGRSAPNGYSENMSDAEYRAWRKSQGARWAQS